MADLSVKSEKISRSDLVNDSRIFLEYVRRHGVDAALLMSARPYLEMIGLAWLTRVSRETGIGLRELLKSVRDIAVLELLTSESGLSIEDAIEIGDEVNREAWRKLREKIRQ